MKSLFIGRVQELMKQGMTSPEEIFNVIKPEYDKKGSVVSYSNVLTAISCVNNGWYLGTEKEKENESSAD